MIPRMSQAMNNVAAEMVESLRHTALLVQALQGLTRERSPDLTLADSAFSQIVGEGRPVVATVVSGPLYPAAILVIVRLRTVS